MSSILNQYTFFNKKFNFEGEELSELLKKENERLVCFCYNFDGKRKRERERVIGSELILRVVDVVQTNSLLLFIQLSLKFVET